MIHFLKTVEQETNVFGVLNINTLENEKYKTKYCNFLKAYDFDIRNSNPNTATSTSRSCIDLFITQKSLETETIETTISDHYSVIAKFNSETTFSSRVTNIVRFLEPFKSEKSLNFLFSFDQKLKDMDFDMTTDVLLVCISKTIMDFVDKFAPEN